MARKSISLLLFLPLLISGQDGMPDEAEMERLAAIGARYGAEILGPPPNR